MNIAAATAVVGISNRANSVFRAIMTPLSMKMAEAGLEPAQGLLPEGF